MPCGRNAGGPVTSNPDQRFLTPAELVRVFGGIPDHAVDKDAFGTVIPLGGGDGRHDRATAVPTARAALA
jgi:hypothetical protein